MNPFIGSVTPITTLVSRSLNTMMFADGAYEGRSRSEKEVMQGHRRRRATQRSPATPISPKGGGGTPPISLSRTRRRRACHKRHRIYGTRHLVKAVRRQPPVAGSFPSPLTQPGPHRHYQKAPHHELCPGHFKEKKPACLESKSPSPKPSGIEQEGNIAQNKDCQ